jgi:hypothetical protein
MSDQKTVKIFTMVQQFPCGPKSTCCGPIGQSKEEIEALKSKITNDLSYDVEVIDVTNFYLVETHYQVAQLLSSTGPSALPILTLGDDIVSMGRATPEMVVEAIREKASQL